MAERIEKVTLGVADGFSIGIDTRYDAAAQTRVYGYTNHPDRATKTDCTAPTATNGTTIVSEVLALRELLIASGFYGPYMLYVSTGYDAVLDNDLKTESSITVRQRLREIDGINDVRRVDYLTGNQLILVQMTADVARAVNGMSIQTVMWETQGRMKRNFRIMGIQVPQIRSTISNRCGVAHGTTS